MAELTAHAPSDLLHLLAENQRLMDTLHRIATHEIPEEGQLIAQQAVQMETALRRGFDDLHEGRVKPWEAVKEELGMTPTNTYNIIQHDRPNFAYEVQLNGQPWRTFHHRDAADRWIAEDAIRMAIQREVDHIISTSVVRLQAKYNVKTTEILRSLRAAVDASLMDFQRPSRPDGKAPAMANLESTYPDGDPETYYNIRAEEMP